MNLYKQELNQKGYCYIPKIIPIEFCHFFTHVLMREEYNCSNGKKGDTQIPNAKSILDHEYLFETLQERLWNYFENIFEEELLPTYSYARLYSNGDELIRHRDRPACEVSVTLQLGRSHHYAWPIFMGNSRIDMGEGDGVMYMGCDVEHWREPCNGPEGYYSGQVFFHYVRKNGRYANEFGDSTNRQSPSYEKNRTYIMESK